MSTVTKYLSDHEIEFLALDHRRTQTAIDEAHVLGLPSERIAKTVVLRAPSGYVLAVIPASKRINIARAAEAVNGHVELASEKEIARAFPGYELGAIPPIAELLGIPVFVDEQLVAEGSVTFASGRQVESVTMHTADILADEKATVVKLCEPYPFADEDWME